MIINLKIDKYGPQLDDLSNNLARCRNSKCANQSIACQFVIAHFNL